MAKRIGVLAATVSGLLGAACGGGGGGDAAGTGPANTQSAFINQYCDVYGPCCAATGRTCRSTLTTFLGLFLAATYGQAAGETCLAALREAAKQPGFCETSKDKPIACAPALGQTGTVAPGAACAVTNDCAPSPEGSVDCFHPNTTSFCQVQIRGHAGDGPCVWTADVGSFSGSGFTAQDGIARGYLCYLADGLFCDLGTGCAARRGPGGACLGNESCADTAFCDYTLAGGTCVARKPADARCVGEDECAKGYYCKSSAGTCSPKLPERAVCATGAECLSALCDNSACGEGPRLTARLHLWRDVAPG
jgi:hypothetical protein